MKILQPRREHLFSAHFVDAVCAFNGYTGLTQFQGAVGNEKFSLGRKPSRRAIIYRFMLNQMNTHERYSSKVFKITSSTDYQVSLSQYYHNYSCSGTCGLIQKVLAPFVEGEESVGGRAVELPNSSRDEGAGGVLFDCLTLIASKEMRVCFSKGGGADNSENVNPLNHPNPAEGGDKGIKAAAVEKAVISRALKQNMVENVIPTLLGLKVIFEKLRSPFLKELMVCLREVVADYKNDLASLMPADQQLAKELEYDLKKMDSSSSSKDTEDVGGNAGKSKRLSLWRMYSESGMVVRESLGVGGVIQQPRVSNASMSFGGTNRRSLPKVFVSSETAALRHSLQSGAREKIPSEPAPWE